eukprot:1804161-Pyramimonas_sp.AAC.1
MAGAAGLAPGFRPGCARVLRDSFGGAPPHELRLLPPKYFAVLSDRRSGNTLTAKRRCSLVQDSVLLAGRVGAGSGRVVGL